MHRVDYVRHLKILVEELVGQPEVLVEEPVGQRRRLKRVMRR